MGFGVGAAMTAASAVIMLSAPEEQAGMAASVEEVSFELGGALGIALLGSLMSALYSKAMVIPQGLALADEARDSLDEALILAEGLNPDQARQVIAVAQAAFDHAFVGVVATAVAMLIAVAFTLYWKLNPR
jgi:DHA2 family multidrug resistance protein-like MFS transporter